MRERLHNIAQDIYILNRSCGEEIVRSSLARARRETPKKRRRARRNRVRPVKQACSDTTEETISSTDECAPQRKRVRVNNGRPPRSTTHITFNTSFHLHITISHSNNVTSHRTILHKCGTVSWSVLNSLGLEANTTSISNELIRSAPAPALLNTREYGGYAGIRVGEAQNPGPATHDRDWTVTEQPNAAHRRINEAGDSVPSSQDSVTRGVRKLRISGSPAAPAALPAPPPSINRNSGRPRQSTKQPREYLRCEQCGPDPAAHMASTDGVWGKNTEVSCCLPTVWRNCAALIARPVLLAGPSGRSWASECSGHLYGSRSATPSELAASTSWRTSGRQPELLHPGRRFD